ncbi:MAG TPA: hypothetical protein VN843_33825, partial [Anaerolineales bacterium]|nr:hypothetical protein [Anaerolineales bacterium]
NEKPIEIPLRKRRNYAYGMVLGVEDFQEEQGYFIDRMRVHNRALHGYGTVSGLEVSNPEDTAASIIVNAGVAIDSMGNEIILPSAVECPLPDDGEVAYLVLYWAERGIDPVPVLGSTNEDNQTVASRVEEYAMLKYESEEDASNTSGVVLAYLKKFNGQWETDKKFSIRRANA